MAPLFFFLASSFNVELVYIILKGITQFSYISKGKILKQNKNIDLKIEKDDVTITLNKIKIKNLELWSNLKTDEQIKSAFLETGDSKR